MCIIMELYESSSWKWGWKWRAICRLQTALIHLTQSQLPDEHRPKVISCKIKADKPLRTKRRKQRLRRGITPGAGSIEEKKKWLWSECDFVDFIWHLFATVCNLQTLVKCFGSSHRIYPEHHVAYSSSVQISFRVFSTQTSSTNCKWADVVHRLAQLLHAFLLQTIRSIWTISLVDISLHVPTRGRNILIDLQNRLVWSSFLFLGGKALQNSSTCSFIPVRCKDLFTST